jgi:hypothetical protein
VKIFHFLFPLTEIEIWVLVRLSPLTPFLSLLIVEPLELLECGLRSIVSPELDSVFFLGFDLHLILTGLDFLLEP